jgi:ribosomal protein S18 acetylase RimI-like enzyme
MKLPTPSTAAAQPVGESLPRIRPSERAGLTAKMRCHHFRFGPLTHGHPGRGEVRGGVVSPTPHNVEVFELRRYQDADAAAVWHLHEEGLSQMDARAGHGPRDEDLRSVRSTYLASGGEFLVGLLDGEVVAMGALRRVSQTVGQIKRMRVDIRFQRRGFGRAVLRALETRARELGYRRLHLDTTTRQAPAQSLFASSGYQEVGRGTYPSGQQMIVFEKEIV